MSVKVEIIRGILLLIVGVAGAVFIGWRWMQRSEDSPRVLIRKWLASAAVIGFHLIFIAPMFVKMSNATAFVGIPMTAACGLVLALIWGSSIGRMVARPLTSMFDGGDEEPEPVPVYSISKSLINRGRYTEAVAAIREQLARFPDSFEGILLLASVQAVHQHDLASAEQTLRLFCDRQNAPSNLVFSALSRLADWHVELHSDLESARAALHEVTERLPGTEFARQAAQRIAHLQSTKTVLASRDVESVRLKEGVQNLGLLDKTPAGAMPVEQDPASRLAELIRHLDEHPLDELARVEVANIYVHHLGRLDLARDQIEQLIAAHPGSRKQVIQWLNLLATLEVEAGEDIENVRATLQRIIQMFPDKGGADLARERIELLPLEYKAKQKSQAVKLGSYEQNIGLKMYRRP
jgi:tetratricopeptide (TPR) repeat protein